MITTLRYGDTVITPTYKIVGLSTDNMNTIPPVPNGTTFFQMDTGLTLMWDENNERWYKIAQATATGKYTPSSDSSDDDSNNLVDFAIVGTALAG